jgi:ferredoxin--NADP+ reductase
MENKKSSLEKRIFRAKVIECDEIAKEKYLLRIEKVVNFKPGQVVAISDKPNSTPRLYSLCSGVEDEYLQILFDLKSDGEFTPKLALLKSGDMLYISEPFGGFLPTEIPMWWIATGTGIAPFYSMFRSGFRSNVKLIHGARLYSNFYFDKEFRNGLSDNYVQCISNGKNEADFNGRVTEYLLQLEQLPLDNKYYLCGQSAMVIETRDLLIKRGVPFTNIVAEIYF